MKNLFFVCSLALVGSVASAMAHASCEDVFTAPPFAVISELPTQAKAREALTQATSDGNYGKSSLLRESSILASINLMKREIKSESTPLMELYTATGVRSEVLISTPGYHSGVVERIGVSRLGESGRLFATLLLPVSGHTGLADAQKWATTDTYSIYQVENGKRIPLEINRKSLGFVTAQELEITLTKGQVARIEYHRSGSGGPAGYLEGRVIELEWDGT